MLRGGGLLVQKVLLAVALLAGLAEALKAAGLRVSLVGVVVVFVLDIMIAINNIRIFIWTWAGALAELRDQLRWQIWQIWAALGTPSWWSALEAAAAHSPHLAMAAAACLLALGLRALLRWVRGDKK
jgi:hypothetical protein